MSKINISFINYGGLSYGGAHRQSMVLAKVLNKDIFNVRYFWCKHILDKYSDASFPTQDLSFVDELKESGVIPVEFRVGYRDISETFHAWKDTNFFEVYNKYPTDLMFAVRSGRPEFPTIHINRPLIEWNVFGSVDNVSSNLIYSVGVSPWVQRTYIENGGNSSRSGYCFYGLEEAKTNENLRSHLNISKNQIVIGFHQRNDDNIFSEHAMNAWKYILSKTNKKIYFLVLGGSDKYKDLALKLGIDVHFLPVVFDSFEVAKFLNTLDIFSHSAGAGESLGIAVQEAMIHKLPVVSIYGKNNGHIDVIGKTIEIAKTQQDYNRIILDLVEDSDKRNLIGSLSYKRALEEFSIQSMKNYFENLFLKKQLEYQNTTFRVPSFSIYDKFSFRRALYRFLYSFPILMRFATTSYLIYKKILRFTLSLLSTLKPVSSMKYARKIK